jgi:hypothetical protein
MAKPLLQCIEGTRDYLGDAGRRFESVFAAAAAVFARYPLDDAAVDRLNRALRHA